MHEVAHGQSLYASVLDHHGNVHVHGSHENAHVHGPYENVHFQQNSYQYEIQHEIHCHLWHQREEAGMRLQNVNVHAHLLHVNDHDLDVKCIL